MIPVSALELTVVCMSLSVVEYYSHVRMAAKRTAVDRLASGLMSSHPEARDATTDAVH